MTQLTLVTGNNNGICISEYKSSSFNDLSPSLCSLNLFATTEFLYYSITQEGTAHYLKKLQWKDSPKECLEREFDQGVEFAKTKALFFGSNLKLIPKSFHQKDSTTAQLLETSTISDSLIMSTFGAFTASYTVDSNILKAITSKFPASALMPVIENHYVASKQHKNDIKLFQLDSQTILLLFVDQNLVLAEQYETPTETECLYFVLSALQIHGIENTEDCTLELVGCQKRENIYKLFNEYFANINFPNSMTLANSISLPDSELNDFQFVLGKDL